ncbi:MAG: universal stress protein [Propionibacteriaceae bacterium]|jgi:nucleotide-binding universal stress UspA family protein|nr:universal stress protein [Propionibacteriaceae bacterium]
MPKYYDGPPRVLVGYDGTEDSYAALRLGALEALHREADLIIVNAVDDIVFGSAWGVVFDADKAKHEAAGQLVEAVSKAQAEGVPLERIRTDVLVGNPAAQLSQLSGRVSLVVVGRREIATRPYVGSTTIGLVGTARCPVIVTSASHSIPKGGWRKLTVGVDVPRNRGRVALTWGYSVGDSYEAELTALGVVREQGGRFGRSLSGAALEKAIGTTREQVTALVEPYEDANPDVETSIQVVAGDPLKQLVEATKRTELMIIEVQSAFPSYAVGAIARGVMARAHCPVGLVRAKEEYAS